MKERALQLIQTDTGELQEGCEKCDDIIQLLKKQLEGAERDLRAWRTRYAQLAEDKEAEAKDSDLWDPAEELFNYWRIRCRHPNSKFNLTRFREIEPYLRGHGKDVCKLAIEGAAYDPYTTQRRNGTEKRHDGWELIHRDAGKFEEFANRAPR